MAGKEKIDLVHQNAIHIETIRKEQIHQKLHTEFSINPHRKLHVLPDKPMSRKPSEVIAENYVTNMESFFPTKLDSIRSLHDWDLSQQTESNNLDSSPLSMDFINAFHKARQEPTKKYAMPLTESHEIGWVSAPLIPSNRNDGRFNFYRFSTDVTIHKESALRASN